MADNIYVSPTPIQRNKFDVAVELTNLHSSRFGFTSEENIQEIFSQYYALARFLDNSSVADLKYLVNEDIYAKVKS
jgi:hypothetical protein